MAQKHTSPKDITPHRNDYESNGTALWDDGRIENAGARFPSEILQRTIRLEGDSDQKQLDEAYQDAGQCWLRL